MNLSGRYNGEFRTLAGSGDITLKGTTKDLTTKIAGSGDFNGSNLSSKNVTAKITGSGDISVFAMAN